MRARSVLAGVVFAAIVIGGIDTRFVRLLLDERPVIRYPEYERFLAEVARRTRRGEAIAIAVPSREWGRGYAYAYYRASYYLAGRRVIPLVDADDRAHLERVGEADVVAAWNVELAELEPLWSAHGGTLYRRGR